MKYENKRLYGGVIKAVVIIVGAIAACRFTSGYFAVAMVVLALAWAAQNKPGLCLCCYALFPFMMVFNYLLLPKTSVYSICLRLGPLIMAVMLLLTSARRKGRERLPFGGLAIFMVTALMSSIPGYSFQISLFKIVNFVVFVVGLWFGTQNLHKRPLDFVQLRYFFLGLSAVVVFGSLATLPFPAIAYPVNSLIMMRQGLGLTEVNTIMANRESMSLFAGVLGHSQMLAPVCTCVFGFVACDMLFLERRFTWLHCSMLAALPVMVYLTRSRTGLFSFSVMLFMVFVYVGQRITLPFKVKSKVNRMIRVALLLFVVAALYAQISTGAITRWLFKTDDVNTIEFQQANAVQSITATRMGLINESLRDFARNPILGSGFQVNFDSAGYASSLLVMSAPVEKGLLPVMILGEGGILGCIAFLGFLISFYTTCSRRRYYVTMAMFTSLLATNIGEATFFSPGGIGGTLWVVAVGGGFCIDIALVHRRMMASFSVPRTVPTVFTK